MKHLTEMVRQHKAGKTNAIYAVCSAHPLVLEAAIRYASANQTPLLIEATSNQVDQFGGYTGMTPADFRGFVCQLADSLNFPQDALILGGDHLGPNRWQNLPAAQAMALPFQNPAFHHDRASRYHRVKIQLFCEKQHIRIRPFFYAAFLRVQVERFSHMGGHISKGIFEIHSQVLNHKLQFPVEAVYPGYANIQKGPVLIVV